MNLVIVCLCIFLLVLLVLFLRDLYVQIRLRQMSSGKRKVLTGLINRLSTGSAITEEEIITIAQVPSLRIILYALLESHQRLPLFPAEFYTEEKGAESYLVNWLEFPTELGRPPDEIVLLKNVTLDFPDAMRYYAFKFRATQPVWAMKLGWMLGVCGPYDDQSLPFDIPAKTFSRFNPANMIDAEEEVQWVHEHIRV